MNRTEILLLGFTMLGGLALFIFGMNLMAEGLRRAAGPHLRSVLTRATRNRVTGFLLGVGLGSSVQSSAATVMLVGFCNAGLLSLAAAIPPMLGANLGTAISMQLVSLKLGDYCFVMISLGLIANLLGPAGSNLQHVGRALLGFGLLFLGMNTMGDAIRPHRDALTPFLVGLNGDSLPAMLAGIGISAGLTAIWQSSGATIGMCYALTAAGVFTRLSEVYPIVLGAQIGTCATALLGSIGTNIEARRAAASHLFFNLFNVALAVAAAPLFLAFIPGTAGGLIQQTANLHTAVKLAAILVVLPLSGSFARLVAAIVRSSARPPEPSHLDRSILPVPEQAIEASIRELRRVAHTCDANLGLVARLILQEYRRQTVRVIKLNEDAIDEIKREMKAFLAALSSRALSRRQAILIQYINGCMTDIERIGDHIDEICDISLLRHKARAAIVDRDLLKMLFRLYGSVRQVLRLVIDSLDPGREDFKDVGLAILQARDSYMALSQEIKRQLFSELAQKEASPTAAMYLAEYISAFDRIVKHARSIALVERKPDFWIKRKKLGRVVGEAKTPPLPERVNVRDFLDELHMNDL